MTTPNRPPLSPAAQVVVDAFENASDGEYVEGVWVVNERTMLAAALRAAAASKPGAGHAYGKTLWHVGWDAAMDHVEAIAAELEAQS